MLTAPPFGGTIVVQIKQVQGSAPGGAGRFPSWARVARCGPLVGSLHRPVLPGLCLAATRPGLLSFQKHGADVGPWPSWVGGGKVGLCPVPPPLFPKQAESFYNPAPG